MRSSRSAHHNLGLRCMPCLVYNSMDHEEESRQAVLCKRACRRRRAYVDLDGGQETRKLGAVPNLKPGRWCRGGPGKVPKVGPISGRKGVKVIPSVFCLARTPNPLPVLSPRRYQTLHALDIRYRTLPTRNFSVMTHPNTEPQPQEFHNCCLSPE